MFQGRIFSRMSLRSEISGMLMLIILAVAEEFQKVEGAESKGEMR